jgi:hypothetical protein
VGAGSKIICFLEGRLLQVDTFTAVLSTLDQLGKTKTHTRKPAKNTTNKTILQKKVFFVFMFFCFLLLCPTLD